MSPKFHSIYWAGSRRDLVGAIYPGESSRDAVHVELRGDDCYRNFCVSDPCLFDGWIGWGYPVEIVHPLGLDGICDWGKCLHCMHIQHTKQYKIVGLPLPEFVSQLTLPAGTVIRTSHLSIPPRDIAIVAEAASLRPEYLYLLHSRLSKDVGEAIRNNSPMDGIRFEFGLETLNNEYAKLLNKGVETEEAINTIIEAANCGARISLDMLHGFPKDEDFEDELYKWEVLWTRLKLSKYGDRTTWNLARVKWLDGKVYRSAKDDLRVEGLKQIAGEPAHYWESELSTLYV